uniref:ATP-dependent DNA helicase n=1 Tax=Amphimedon queenslandica TaxID=400682 RepID=A0A1X7V6J0_AMPQE
MLRCNIDVTVALVNGVIHTVMGIYPTHISIKFDPIKVPCDIHRVTSKNLYIHSKKFPFLLSYAITIQKCQGLSLQTAIIDLLTNVFWDSMAYVALSRVHTINGFNLLLFDAFSVKVSNPCINEINRLKIKFRKKYLKSRRVKERERFK